MKDLNPTTRCFPHSLQEAWPTHYPEWLEPPPKKSTDWLLGLVGIVLWMLIAALLLWK
jgi:hypothetical protein